MQWDFDTLKRPCPPLPAEAFEFGPPGKSLFETTFRSNFLNMFLYAIFTKRMSSCPSFWMRMQLICTALQAYTAKTGTEELKSEARFNAVGHVVLLAEKLSEWGPVLNECGTTVPRTSNRKKVMTPEVLARFREALLSNNSDKALDFDPDLSPRVNTLVIVIFELALELIQYHDWPYLAATEVWNMPFTVNVDNLAWGRVDALFELAVARVEQMDGCHLIISIDSSSDSVSNGSVSGCHILCDIIARLLIRPATNQDAARHQPMGQSPPTRLPVWRKAIAMLHCAITSPFTIYGVAGSLTEEGNDDNDGTDPTFSPLIPHLGRIHAIYTDIASFEQGHGHDIPGAQRNPRLLEAAEVRKGLEFYDILAEIIETLVRNNISPKVLQMCSYLDKPLPYWTTLACRIIRKYQSEIVFPCARYIQEEQYDGDGNGCSGGNDGNGGSLPSRDVVFRVLKETRDLARDVFPVKGKVDPRDIRGLLVAYSNEILMKAGHLINGTPLQPTLKLVMLAHGTLRSLFGLFTQV